jgi:hypothetical protein
LESYLGGVDLKNGANALYLDEKLLACLQKGSEQQAERIATIGYYKWQEEHKKELAIVAGIVTKLAYRALFISASGAGGGGAVMRTPWWAPGRSSPGTGLAPITPGGLMPIPDGGSLGGLVPTAPGGNLLPALGASPIWQWGTPQLIGASGVDPPQALTLPASSEVERWKQTVRDELLNTVQNDKLKNAINEIYQDGATIGDGGLADAVRHELLTGELVKGKSHIQKASERLRNLENLIKKQNLSPHDLDIANKLIEDIRDALGGK